MPIRRSKPAAEADGPVPVAETVTPAGHVHVVVDVPEHFRHIARAEELDAVPLGASRFRLTSVPVWAIALTVGDVVHGVREIDGDGTIWVERVVDEGGHWNARLEPLGDEALEQALALLEPLGCTVTMTGYGIITVDVPATAPEVEVDARIRTYDGVTWNSDRGVVPPSQRPAM